MIELRLLGLKNHEIAQMLDVNEKNIEYNMREAIEQLSHTINHSNLDKATIAGGLLLINIMLTIL
jgi:RNA polymerase sigma-70 factor (ECF subfamily)